MIKDDPCLPQAVAALRAQRVVVYPTETVYGMGVDAMSPAALAELVSLKGRDAQKGLSVLVADLESAGSLLAAAPPAGARALARVLWPGPLTLVLPAASSLPEALVGATGGVGLRCTTDPLASALVREFAGPITATSANPSGSAPATDAARARAYFKSDVQAYIDDGPRDSSAVSSVVEFLDGRAYLRRIGAISAEEIARHVELEH